MRRHLCLLQHQHEGHVRGSIARGVRPYIQFFRASYTSHSLASRADLIGQPVKIYFDVEDVRLLRVFDVGGRELGVVEVQGAWRHTAHTLRMRREILALVRDRKLLLVRYDDPVQCYLEYLRKHAGKRRRSASKAETARRAVQDASPAPQAPPGPVQSDDKTRAPLEAASGNAEDATASSGPVKGRSLSIGTGQVFSR
ncbi:hypothetical protein [Massilia niastensis]|uniref:hypothetical protein n=1 Tax=Massilia niastensis TaxID=544911 RepID=UPI0012EC8FCF|nr:hypothetical protein [Massilia niastensis]